MNEIIFDGENAKELSVSETIHQLRLDNKYLKLQIINLQSKIDKAIEYIEENIDLEMDDFTKIDIGCEILKILDLDKYNEFLKENK